MTQQKWDKHKEHMEEHVVWPATKAEIIAACQGLDVEAAVLEEMKMTIPDGEKEYGLEEIRAMLVTG